MIRLYAHRGASAELPENSMAAFARAVDLGVDALELDVHCSADGAVVVFHDDDGRRMAGVDARVCETPVEALRRWDLGHGFVTESGDRPHVGRGHGVPLLAELLHAWPHLPLNIDIKQRRPTIVHAVIAEIRRAGAEERCLLSSFSSATLRSVRAAGYRGPTGSSRDEVVRLAMLPWWLNRSVAGDRVQIPVRHGQVRLAAPWLLQRCRRLGKAVDFWTIDDPFEARELMRLGVDGIMTNDPATIGPIVQGNSSRR